MPEKLTVTKKFTTFSFQDYRASDSGKILSLITFMKEAGCLRVPFIPFAAERFNTFFYNGIIVYYLHNHFEHFIDFVKGYDSLLGDTHLDLQIKSCLKAHSHVLDNF